jgi:hypothetical protein
VEPEELPDAEDLWWSWVVLAAQRRAIGGASCRFDPQDRVLALDAADGSWLRMQRSHGSRATLWGRSARASATAPDARRTAPDWALSEATEAGTPTFLAWHAHGEWDTSAPCHDEGVVHLLRPLLTIDPRTTERARAGRLSASALTPYADRRHLEDALELVRLAGVEVPRRAAMSGGSVACLLRDQIHRQMRDAHETPRVLPKRPIALVQWNRVAGPPGPFEYAVTALRDRIVPASTNPAMTGPAELSLTNVLGTLHRDEARDDWGAWLFARVTSDGIAVRLERAFDSWPAWHQVSAPGEGPSMEDLAWEMHQRSPAWRPAWASLLPS